MPWGRGADLDFPPKTDDSRVWYDSFRGWGSRLNLAKFLCPNALVSVHRGSSPASKRLPVRTFHPQNTNERMVARRSPFLPYGGAGCVYVDFVGSF